jgi:predicted ATP-binding protein involved in virulence
MRLISFSGKGIYDLFDLDTIEFDPGVTFLTGINGTGKTTAVYSIFSLITPNLHNLARVPHALFSLCIENKGEKMEKIEKMEIRSSNNGKILTLKVISDSIDTTAELNIAIYPGSSDPRGTRFEKEERQYYLSEFQKNFINPVLQKIKDLPNPMFLDLERVHYDEWERPESTIISETHRSAVKQSFIHSLRQAQQLADREYRDVQVEIRNYAEELKKGFFKTALTAPDLQEVEFSKTLADENMSAKLPTLRGTFAQLGLADEKLLEELSIFLKEMSEAGEVYKRLMSTELDLENAEERDRASFFKWMDYRQRYKQLRAFLDIAVEYNGLIESAKMPISNYLALVNRFLKASNKELFFDEKDRLRITIGSKVSPTSWVNTLSSGEGQLFALLTNIALGSETETSRVCIIDEPEVSLHVLWQELFVTAVREADPNLQLILATHSPSIINGDNEHCRNLRLTPTTAKI